MSSVSALSAYRQLLRATRIAFEGDYRVLHAARAEARKQFDDSRKPGVDTPMKIQYALETAQILKTNLVQGQRMESRNELGETIDSYSLRIHEHIERGDNDTIKTAGNKAVKVKPCSK
ncbi:Mitochondrial zinc maintenance protein 1, mitochondrial [Ophidiomyces ophidiicola]|uniref:Mitochondrial zinc maintenance protein 1, mitochondrial n=1 Tax=Ophidiomyces ophidiicola TaxID=1387563 RepID=A0ACB8UV60_9EURO|nr:Mitochondrial zinc maintenance protein 1, mitochondrial [Ophidiomyces ophidiicola]KAI1945768.1 Mitochondrial zinc maintenance protein 1, mitochondrial [Ophidiomyces ophidiicola]KAI1950686.1 Mitochondrial zinc maintenance protein 1, mitochondrial [Ophidiomyces ophidiicola]KAI1972649.1 Mitochondrial zinc maintenance protein 1, mitochondrial [Ophidiomyces ophidiicola]KAI2006600.1 Mitochondrial zinc maintenance protein 1, mitochondrial [Ophidiomyces ophidiicola]KAI2018311.1 Mitochondrial zinc m